MKKIICVLFIFTIIMLGRANNKEVVLIPKESIRFRIIANSNNALDQSLKSEIKNKVQTQVISKLSTESYKSTEDNIKKSISIIDEVLKDYEIDYNISYGQNYFPKKTYKGVTYPEGDYQSLVITIGEGLGDNWWCVLFPPLCLLEAEENNYEDVQYQLYVNKILDKFSY